MKIIAINYQRKSETWWDAAREAFDSTPPPTCVDLIFNEETVTVGDADAEAFLRWAAKLPGWSDNPLTVHEAP